MRNYIVSLILIISYIGVIFFGVFIQNDHHHSVCPFSMGQNNSCTMSIGEHVDLIKIVTQTVAASALFIFIFLFVAPILFFVNKFNKENIRKKDELKFPIHRKPDIYQTLFSKGILNPKSP